jgi:hypothetical protein
MPRGVSRHASVVPRILVNYTLRRDTWYVHAIADDGHTPISPTLPVGDQAMLMRLLRYVGAGDSDIDDVNEKIGYESRGSTWIDLVPGRRNLLRIHSPWSERAHLAG